MVLFSILDNLFIATRQINLVSILDLCSSGYCFYSNCKDSEGGRMRRQLSVQEKEICNNSIKRMSDQIDYLSYLKEYDELMSEEGVLISFDNEMVEYKNNLKAIKGNTPEDNFKRKYYQLMIKKGIRFNFKKKINDLKAEIKGISNDIETNKQNIKILKEQIKMGVEVKEDKPPIGV